MADGLTPNERKCLLHLATAWNLFVAMPTKHPSETHEFQSAIHNAQCLIALRVAMRVNPDDWYQPANTANPTSEVLEAVTNRPTSPPPPKQPRRSHHYKF